MTRIQLDRKLVKPSALDRNLIQVNAQAAWDAGATGQGAKLAVLDTGVDATHPDLAGRVAAAEDFTGAVDPTDRLGHGTHVAGIAAGSGAAAAGERRGLAFDADLLVGKVCDDTGSCADSAIIAGMEWAAAQGAKVVNLSLGGPHTDGLEPGRGGTGTADRRPRDAVRGRRRERRAPREPAAGVRHNQLPGGGAVRARGRRRRR